MTPQNKAVLRRLKEGGWLSTLEATKELYQLRLGARIYEIKKLGYGIKSRRVMGKSYNEYLLYSEPTSFKLPESRKLIEPVKQNSLL